MFIDTHAHLVAPEFDADRDDVIKRAQAAGVEAIIVPGTDLDSSRKAVELSERYDCIYACVGVHPHEAGGATEESLKRIEALCSNQKVVAIGEIGLDYFYDFSPRDQQIDVFRSQLDLAARRDLPVVVHTREPREGGESSIADAIHSIKAAVMTNVEWGSNGATRNQGQSVRRGVFHCFSGDESQAREVFALGCLVSFPGIVTFKNSTSSEVLRALGCENILLETDSPYLTPVPYRGRRNEPAYLRLIAEKVSEICNASIEEISRKTSLNVAALFPRVVTSEP